MKDYFSIVAVKEKKYSISDTISIKITRSVNSNDANILKFWRISTSLQCGQFLNGYENFVVLVCCAAAIRIRFKCQKMDFMNKFSKESKIIPV